MTLTAGTLEQALALIDRTTRLTSCSQTSALWTIHRRVSNWPSRRWSGDPSLRCSTRQCENRRHSRGLGWRAGVSGWQILEFRLWTGGFAAPVSARHFPIPVSAYPRPVRYVTETGLRSRFRACTAAKVERWIDCPVRGKARRRRSWPAEPRIAHHARRRHEICGFEILLTVRGSECEPNQRAFNETLRVPLALSGHCENVFS